jgi:hypothetical protein
MQPPYIKQSRGSTCSLAVLRMVLAAKHIFVTEEVLIDKVIPDYGKDFKNIWNPTIAKLAREYGLEVKIYAMWPLLKKDQMQQALQEYKTSPETFNVNKYENPEDEDAFPEPLPLAYREMFEALKLGCEYEYGDLNKNVLSSILSKGNVIQTAIKLKKLYPEKYKEGYHSILLYALDGKDIIYNDPYNGEGLRVSIEKLLESASDVGAFMEYRI